MLKRHCELMKELKTFEKIAVDELSVEDLAYYLKLRREYEETQGQFVNLVPTALEKVKRLVEQSGEQLEEVLLMADSVLGGDFNQRRYDLVKQLVETMGALETNAEQVAAGCSRLWEMLDAELAQPFSGGETRSNDLAGSLSGDMLLEVAATMEKQATAQSVSINGAVSAIVQAQGQAGQKTKEENREKVAVSPATVKKLELMVGPKENEHFRTQPAGEKRNDKVVKITAPPESKPQSAKGNKDRPKR